jgi:hypothetical protein
LNPGDAAGWINLQNLRHVSGEVQNDGHVAALASKGCPTASAQDRSAVFTGKRNRGDDIISISRKDHPDGNLTIVRSVGCVESAGAAIEADPAANVAAQVGRQSLGIHVESLTRVSTGNEVWLSRKDWR